MFIIKQYTVMKQKIIRTNFESINEYQIISPLQMTHLNYDRIVGLGDVHGHYSQFITIMKDANICNSNGEWIANNTILVQTGDIFDRKPDSFKVLRTLILWHRIAPRFNSLCLMIMVLYSFLVILTIHIISILSGKP